MTTLDQLRPGQSATIMSISDEGPQGQRLMALGLIAGSPVQVTRFALGGDPIEIEVMGYCLCLRKEEARRVQVNASRS